MVGFIRNTHTHIFVGLLVCLYFFCFFGGGKDLRFSLNFYSFWFLGLHIHGLAHAASGYHRVLEENRKLYNQVQDLKGNKISFLKLKHHACVYTSKLVT